MHKKLCLLLACVMFAGGCKEETAELSDHTLDTKIIETAKYMEEGNWSEITKDFPFFDRSDVKEEYEALGVSNCVYGNSEVSYGDSENYGTAVFSCDEGNLIAHFTVNDSLEITDIDYSMMGEGVSVSEGETYTETILVMNDFYETEGILTLPLDVEDPPVVFLVGESLYDSADASGDDASFRKDMAHELAAMGVASVRFNMPLYTDPYVIERNDVTLDSTILNIFAREIHSIENYPVNALHIYYMGHGIAGTYGYYLVYSHFEMDGGIILLNAPYEDGYALMQYALGVSDADIEKAKQDKDPDMFTKEYFQEWSTLSPSLYAVSLAMPILIETSTTDSTYATYDDWGSVAGSNVTRNSYENLDHALRSSDGALSEEVLHDINVYFNGEEEETEEEEDAS